MHVTLVQAGISTKGFSSVGQGMDGGWISHGLAALSACAKAQGFTVDLIDLRALSGWDEYRAEIARRRPSALGLTMMSVDFNPIMRCVALAKEVDPGIVTVVGGAHPSICPQEVLDDPLVDFVVKGEGELTFPKLLHAVEAGSPPTGRLVPGERPDLNAQPYPDRDLYLDEWRRAGYDAASPEVAFVPELPPPFVTIIAGRGCIYNCSFCKPAEDYIFGKGTRRRSVDSVMGELRMLRDRFRFNSFMFHDDCLTEDRSWVTEFCAAYLEEGFSQPFFCQSRADIIVRHEETVRLMARCGLKGYFIGFESGSDRVLRFLRKGTTRAVNLEAARICRKYGISVWANYMLGLPTETPEEMAETVSMLRKIDPDYYSPAFYTPHPGSDLYDYCVQHDLSLITDHDSYRRNPTEAKIRGHDQAVLQKVAAESVRRRPANAARRSARRLWKRYASPRKAWRRMKRLVARERAA